VYRYKKLASEVRGTGRDVRGAKRVPFFTRRGKIYRKGQRSIQSESLTLNPKPSTLNPRSLNPQY